MKKSREVLESGRIAQIQTTKNCRKDRPLVRKAGQIDETEFSTAGQK
jgi:hypothetical protein